MGDIYLPLTRFILLANQMTVNLTKQNIQNGDYKSPMYEDYGQSIGGLNFLKNLEIFKKNLKTRKFSKNPQNHAKYLCMKIL